MSQKIEPVIRHATSADTDLLAELGARTFFEAFAADNKAEDMAAYLVAHFSKEQFAVELADPRAVFLIAEIEGREAGYAKLYASEGPTGVSGSERVELVRLYVLQKWLGRGVGDGLMRACIEEARRAGHTALWLGVWEHNKRAQAFYRKWSFREVGQHTFQLGADEQTDLVMERAL